MFTPCRRVDVGVGRRLTPTALALGLLLALAVSRPSPAPGQVSDDPARQVTLLGVLATPHDPRIDPKLTRFEPQLRKLLPGHGFRLLDVQSKRLTAGQSLGCRLQGGFRAEITLLQPTDGNGKVQIRCALRLNDTLDRETVVATPPNQLFFSDKTIPGGNRLLIGVGAR